MKSQAMSRIARDYDTPPQRVLLPALEKRLRGSLVDRVERATYYDMPMVKKPGWRWYIPAYFWVGGIAGGAAVVGAAAHFLGGEKHHDTVRHARWLSLAMAGIAPIPLILDLGRPERFHHMFRVFKISSPLSVGTWILSAFGATSGVLAARQAAEDNFILRRKSRLGRLATLLPAGPLHAVHAVLGICLGGYTGTLLAVSAVPLWAAAGVLLGPLFLATALASGAAALTLIGIVSGRWNDEAGAQIEAIESVGAVAQLSLVVAREALVTPRINAPLRHGLWGRMYQFGAVGGGMVTPLGLRIVSRLLGPRWGRRISALAATLSLFGALAERFAIVEAGKVSAEDPLAYQELTLGAPGDARPTPAQQAQATRRTSRFAAGIAARDTIGSGDPGVR